MLNIIWCAFFIITFIFAIWQSCIGNFGVWNNLVSSIFSSSQEAFNITINLTGMMCLWLGLLKIAEQAGLTSVLAKILQPLFKKIMPDVPSDSPALGSVIMNVAANMLGLDNAATPMGIKAMEQLQDINPHKDKASPAQILFMVINTSSVTLIPISILMYRQQFNSINPSSVFIPILLATSISTLVGFLSVAISEKLPIFNRVVLGYLTVFIVGILGLIYWFNSLNSLQRIEYVSLLSNVFLFTIIICFILAGIVKGLNVYGAFIEGAKEGFSTAVRIIPYMVAMLVSIAVFKASGVLDIILTGVKYIFNALACDGDFIPALPTAFLKPLSGSGARAMMIETFNTYGVDSFVGFTSSIIQGSTETTFYVLAVYFGAIKITKTGSAIPCALIADFAGISAAILLGYMFY